MPSALDPAAVVGFEYDPYDDEAGTAWHEAGHAVHRVIARLPFRYVTIRPRQEDVLGYVAVRPRRIDPVLDAVNAASGSAAEALFYHVCFGEELKEARALVALLGGSTRDRESADRIDFDWTELCLLAETILRPKLAEVEAVARGLLLRRTLSQTEVRLLVDHAGRRDEALAARDGPD